MKEYYRELITELLSKIDDEQKLHDIYVLVFKESEEASDDE